MTGTPESLALAAGGKAAARRFAFASAVLDERTLELLVDGQPAELEPKPLEVLRHLLYHAGEVLTKDELLAAVWPGRILSETVLTKCIARLREVLGDTDQQVIKTVHGYGYRLLAPVKVENSAPATAAPQFDFRPGDHPPQRPLWSLVERLGQGSHGEAWLVRHDKTREQRVYKFAPDSPALHALKREITLYRLLHDALGDAAPCIAALDWNLEEAPYFLETEYAPGGSLVDWVQARNGLGTVPLATRLEIAAQAADGLAAAHSMGVLHKDLKPSNILVVSPPDAPVQVKLGDFGSGGVLDEARLAAMGITRMGFTQTVQAGLAGSTPLYLAPEVIAGQPATVQADIYALGVVLYQLLVGDLWRPLAPGWEQDIEDELLREDIAFAVEGHVERRLGTAAQLAQRLRSLERRHRERTEARAAQSEATRQRIEMQRVLARRGWVRATMAVLAIGLASSVALSVVAFRARNAAAESAATSKAVSDFLSQDMFAQVSSEKPLRELQLKDVLDAAAQKVPARFANQPLAEAQVHASLGASYLALDDVAAAERELDLALQLTDQFDAPGSETALEAITASIAVKGALGKFGGLEARYREQLAAGIQRLGASHPKVLQLRRRLAEQLAALGRQQEATVELRSVLADASAVQPPDEVFIGEAGVSLGLALLFLADYRDAEEVLAKATVHLSARLGPDHATVAAARLRHAVALLATGRAAEADAELAQALATASRWTPSDAAALVLDARILQGRVRIEQNRLDEAVQVLEGVRATLLAWAGPELDQTFVARAPLADAYQRQGRLTEAEVELWHAIRAAEKAYGPLNERVLRFRIALAGILREQGRGDEARAQIAFDAAPLRAFERHPGLGELRREQGLLLAKANRITEARAALAEAIVIFESRFGAQNWRSQRVRDELARIPAATGS